MDSETYLATEHAEIAQTLLDTGRLYLANAAVFHPLGLELEVLVDASGAARGLRLTRLAAPAERYTTSEHNDGMGRLGADSRLDRAWSGLTAEAERISMFLFGGPAPP